MGIIRGPRIVCDRMIVCVVMVCVWRCLIFLTQRNMVSYSISTCVCVGCVGCYIVAGRMYFVWHLYVRGIYTLEVSSGCGIGRLGEPRDYAPGQVAAVITCVTISCIHVVTALVCPETRQEWPTRNGQSVRAKRDERCQLRSMERLSMVTVSPNWIRCRPCWAWMEPPTLASRATVCPPLRMWHMGVRRAYPERV